MKRKFEQIVAIINTILFSLFFGGYSAVILTLDKKNYHGALKQIFGTAFNGLSTEKQLTILQSLGAWFGLTVILVMLLTLITNYLIKDNRSQKKAAVMYIVIGLVALMGSQMQGFVFAFIYFSLAVLCLFRQPRSSDIYTSGSFAKK
jgi:hypothetical protein